MKVIIVGGVAGGASVERRHDFSAMAAGNLLRGDMPFKARNISGGMLARSHRAEA